jgi:hypothetical protein
MFRLGILAVCHRATAIYMKGFSHDSQIPKLGHESWQTLTRNSNLLKPNVYNMGECEGRLLSHFQVSIVIITVYTVSLISVYNTYNCSLVSQCQCQDVACIAANAMLTDG